VFLDRDGVINTLPAYNSGPEQMQLVPGSAQAIRRLHEAGYAVALITSQSCIGLGYVLREMVDAVHDRMCQLLAQESASPLGQPDAIMYSVGTADRPCVPEYADISDAKPRGVLLARAEKILGLPGAWMVGDRAGDLETARCAGLRGILVRTGKGLETEAKLRAAADLAEPVADDLAGAVRLILQPNSGAGSGP
jgi:D-glycero-D-manno-heptose 1,7-bisphosphate phosphatase